jgi:hypothetical protein
MENNKLFIRSFNTNPEKAKSRYSETAKKFLRFCEEKIQVAPEIWHDPKGGVPHPASMIFSEKKLLPENESKLDKEIYRQFAHYLIYLNEYGKRLSLLDKKAVEEFFYFLVIGCGDSDEAEDCAKREYSEKRQIWATEIAQTTAVGAADFDKIRNKKVNWDVVREISENMYNHKLTIELCDFFGVEHESEAA